MIVFDPQTSERGIELDGAPPADAADLEVAPAGPQHLDALRHHRREADEVAREIGAPAARPVADLLDAGPPVGDLREMERVVGPERARELEPLGELVDHDHGAGAHLAGHRDGLDAEAPGALDDDALPEREAGPRQPEDHLGEGAVDRGHEGVGQVVGDAEDEAAGPEVVVLGERPDPVRELARAGGAPDLRRGTRPAGPGGTRSSGRRDRSSSRRRGRPRGAAARASPI